MTASTNSHTQEETFTDAFTIADKKLKSAHAYFKYKNTQQSVNLLPQWHNTTGDVLWGLACKKKAALWWYNPKTDGTKLNGIFGWWWIWMFGLSF